MRHGLTMKHGLTMRHGRTMGHDLIMRHRLTMNQGLTMRYGLTMRHVLKLRESLKLRHGQEFKPGMKTGYILNEPKASKVAFRTSKDHGLRTTNHKRGKVPKYHHFNSFFCINFPENEMQRIVEWVLKVKNGVEKLLNVE